MQDSLPTTTPTHFDLISQLWTTVLIAILGVIQHYGGKRTEAKRNTWAERIEKKIDTNHVEVRRTCEQLAIRIDEVGSLAEDALSQAIGPAPDRKNGLKSRVDDLERWQESETRRQREELERELDRRRALSPTDIGTLTPRRT